MRGLFCGLFTFSFAAVNYETISALFIRLCAFKIQASEYFVKVYYICARIEKHSIGYIKASKSNFSFIFIKRDAAATKAVCSSLKPRSLFLSLFSEKKNTKAEVARARNLNFAIHLFRSRSHLLR